MKTDMHFLIYLHLPVFNSFNNIMSYPINYFEASVSFSL